MGDGQTKQANRTIINMLKAIEEKEKVNWPKHLSKLAFAYNVTVNKSTGYSPYYLMFGRSARLPIDQMFGIAPEEGDVKMRRSWDEYVKEWESSMNEAFDIARQHAEVSRNRNKRYYDKKVRCVDIGVGDRVLHRNREQGGTGKLRN